MTASWAGEEIGRCRYGSTALWTLRGNLAGSQARRFAQRADLFFRGESAALVVDLRGAGMIDSAGASRLLGLRERHPGFAVVGRPSSWVDLPYPVRRAVSALRPAPDLQTALSAFTAPPNQGYAEKRMHMRIPLQIPVEVLCAGRLAPASLRDISRGGLHLALLPEGWLGEARKTGAATTLGIVGLETDPLARELTARFGRGPVLAMPVRALPGGVLGVRFTGSPTPV
ncbi:MAG TPA: PilZ domain-containing protein [Candidatus Methanoperedens sp.]|nr:PilZ domain-containing protein [Candidatus Methanoperedens sp.]